MSGCRCFEILDPSTTIIREISIFKPKTFPSFTEEIELGFDPFDYTYTPPPCFFSPSLTPFDTITDLIQIEKTPFTSTYKRYHQYQEKKIETHLKLVSLADRVSALELGFDKILNAKAKKSSSSSSKDLDRKYSWTAEINTPEKDGVDKKYKWTTEIKGGEKKEEKNYKYVAEFKGKGKESSIDRKYIFKASTTPIEHKKDHSKKKDHKAAPCVAIAIEGAAPKRVVEIEEPVNPGTIILKQAFAKRVGARNNGKGKKKELSPQDASMLIQMTFRAYLIRRSQVLRGLRELAVAKAKLKEIRKLFNNFTYRRRICRDAEERQKFSEKIIVLLLTVEDIEGADFMVRAARRSMVNELEAMLFVVDPQPAGKLGSMRRRKFDLPEGGIQKEIAAGVAEVVQMLDQDEKNGLNTFEVCL